jgi:hypothetical protein
MDEDPPFVLGAIENATHPGGRVEPISATLVKEGHLTVPAGNAGRTYDVAPDGQRFLMIKRGGTESVTPPTSLIVVQHWDQELKRLVPTK